MLTDLTEAVKERENIRRFFWVLLLMNMLYGVMCSTTHANKGCVVEFLPLRTEFQGNSWWCCSFWAPGKRSRICNQGVTN